MREFKLFISLFFFAAFEAIGRSLPSGDDVGEGIIYGIGLALLGVFLYKISSWFRIDDISNSFTKGLNFLGFLSCGAAFICLLPLLFWFEAIAGVIFGFLIIGGVVLAILFWIYRFFNN